MTGVIKAADYSAMGNVRALPTSIPFPKKEDEEQERLRKRISGLEEELRQRDQAIAQLREDRAEAFSQGKSEGLALGAEAAARQDAERLALLRETLMQASADVRERLSTLERLAPLLTQECLDILLADRDFHSELISRTLAKYLKTIERDLVLDISVARKDFPDQETLAVLADACGADCARITAHDDLEAGACRVRLRLGEDDIGLHQQWSRLRNVLANLALPEVQP